MQRNSYHNCGFSKYREGRNILVKGLLASPQSLHTACPIKIDSLSCTAWPTKNTISWRQFSMGLILPFYLIETLFKVSKSEFQNCCWKNDQRKRSQYYNNSRKWKSSFLRTWGPTAICLLLHFLLRSASVRSKFAICLRGTIVFLQRLHNTHENGFFKSRVVALLLSKIIMRKWQKMDNLKYLQIHKDRVWHCSLCLPGLDGHEGHESDLSTTAHGINPIRNTVNQLFVYKSQKC